LAPRTLETLHRLHVWIIPLMIRSFAITTQMNTMKDCCWKFKIFYTMHSLCCFFVSVVYHSLLLVCLFKKLFCTWPSFLIVYHSPIVLGSFTLDVLANSTQVLHQSTISPWGHKYKAIKANLNSTTQKGYNNWQTQRM